MSKRALAPAGALSALQEQVLRTVPGAREAPLAVILGACALAYTLDLNIAAGEVYIASFGSAKTPDGRWEKQYSYGVGIKGARVLADRESRWQVTFRVLPPEEAAPLRGDLYDPGDIGVEATLIRYDDAALSARAGVPYEPRRAIGWYRVKARYNSAEKKWVADQVPNTWTPRDVAEKRAELAALKKSFSWGSRAGVRVIDPAGSDIEYAAAAADRMLIEHQRRLPPPAGGEIDEDGFIIAQPEDVARAASSAISALAAASASDATPAPPPVAIPPEVAAWRKPEDAYAWAVEIGAAANVFAARNAFARIVTAHGGSLTTRNAQEIYLAFYEERRRRAEEKAALPEHAPVAEAQPPEEPVEGLFA